MQVLKLSSSTNTVRVVLLILIVVGSIGSILPSVLAWGVSASPPTRSTVPGGTVTFTIYVTGTVPGNPNVKLWVTPMTMDLMGLSFSFTVNDVPAPFSSSMIVHVDPSKAPGSYTIPIRASPGPTMPGPDDKTTTATIIVGGGFDFNIALSPPSLSVVQGETAKFQILLTYSDPAYSGTTITIQVAGLGPGMNYQLIPSPPGLSIMTSSSTPPGPYTIILQGSAMGVVHQTSAVLTVTEKQPPFDFQIEASPGSQSVRAGQTTTFTVNVMLVSGTAKVVTLSLTGNPVGSTFTFSPNSGNPGFSSSLRISTEASAPPGTYSLTITGQADGATHMATVQLIVEKAKEASSISISVNPTTVTIGESVSVTGVLSPGAAAAIEIIYHRPDGFELTRHVSTSGTGSFSDSFTPDVEGAWSVLARWDGNNDLESSESFPANFMVEAAPISPPSFWEQIPGGMTTLLIAAIAVIAIIAVAAVRRGHRGGPQPTAAMTVRRCSKCGTDNPLSSVYCSSCGERLQ
jgi:hypothetical protein